MNKHVGFPSDRMIFKVSVQNLVMRDTEFGPVSDCTMVTSDGDILFWQTGTSASWLVMGESYTVKATIKGHDVDENGVRRTLILRVEQHHEPQRIARVAVGLSRSGPRRR